MSQVADKGKSKMNQVKGLHSDPHGFTDEANM